MYFKNNILQKAEYAFSIFLSVSFILIVLYKSIVLPLLRPDASYSGFDIPDFMINYQGGFVRRGLLGEILYQIFKVHPYPLHTVVVYFEAIVFIVFLFLSCYVFCKQKYIAIMPFAIIVAGLTWYRRDFLMISLAFLVFYLIIRYIKSHNVWLLMVSVATMVVAILTYEPSFFFIVPICMLLYYQNIDENKNLLFRIGNTLLVFILPIIAMGLVCLAKGTENQANDIWQSWIPLFDYLNMERSRMPSAIWFLSKSESVSDVAMFHLNFNYGICKEARIGFDPLLVSGSVLFFLGIYFLVITTPRKNFSVEQSRLLSSIYLFQFVCLFPMFTILSCDFGRTILYVIFTSFYLEHFLKTNNLTLSVPYLDPISDKVLKLLNQISAHRCFIIHLLVMIFIPFRTWGGVPITRPFVIRYGFILEFILHKLGVW